MQQCYVRPKFHKKRQWDKYLPLSAWEMLTNMCKAMHCASTMSFYFYLRPSYMTMSLTGLALCGTAHVLFHYIHKSTLWSSYCPPVQQLQTHHPFTNILSIHYLSSVHVQTILVWSFLSFLLILFHHTSYLALFSTCSNLLPHASSPFFSIALDC